MAELTLVAGRAEDHFAEAGDVLFGEGSTGGDVFVVLHGKADVRRGGDSVAVVGFGEWFGDVAAVDRTPRAATVVALEPMRLLRVPHDDFTELVARIPSLRRAVLAAVAARAAGNTSDAPRSRTASSDLIVDRFTQPVVPRRGAWRRASGV